MTTVENAGAPVEISLEFTPNPNTLKFVVNRTLVPTAAVNFTAPDQAAKAPLAKRLFEVAGVSAVMLGRNFVTVTKGEGGNWETIHRGTTQALLEHLSAGRPVLDADFAPAAEPKGGDSDVERKIRQILDDEVRPAVAMDGGDIIFQKYENRMVFLHLQGSCHGCPSSLMTLKMGIEQRLRAAIPEIEEVVAV